MGPSKLLVLPVERKVLANGLTVLVQTLPHVASVSAGLNVGVGSRHEIPGQAGISHLIEHMLFQGTQRRDTRELSRVISAVGGTHDASTGRENTTLYAKVPSRYFPLVMDVLADMIWHSRYASRNLAKEKQIILEEIRMYEDAPDELVHDLLFEAFWPRHPLGRPILGSRKSLRSLGRAEMLQFIQTHYSPRNMILAVAGNIQSRQVFNLAQRYFGAASGSGRELPVMAPAPEPVLGEKLEARVLEQTHVCLGMRGLPFADPRRYAALALSNILGNGPNSRLFYEVREKRALVYAIYSFMDFYQDAGMGGIYFACQPGKVAETLQVIRRELASLAAKPITDQELRDVREQMRGYYLISLESSSTHMWNMVQQEMYGQPHSTPAETLQAIGRITKSDIRKLARYFFTRTPMAKAVIGPLTRPARAELRKFGI